MDIFDLSAKITLDSSGYESELSRLEGSTRSAASKIGSILSGIGTAVGAGLTAAAAGAGAIIGKATEGFAEFEQLVGGVETLFGSASDKMQGFADQAFKTAGMSANEYMSTAVGFSAALIRSVGGDTERAANLADTAITDMSDNANKMGTTLESLQNAYTGFSRGNFTMLDNLALGFSGTKEGMQELLAAAEQLTGIEYDISSYADIVEAIHAVQTEMGITGTTAAEAAQTISGSVASMKAAWENWLVGLADENADLSGLTDNLVNSVQTVWTNLEPVLGRIGTSLIEAFSDLTGLDLSGVQTFFESIGTTFAELKTAFEEGGPGAVFDTIVQKISDLTGLDLTGVTGAFDAVSKLFTDLKTAFEEDSVTGVIDTLVQTFDDATGIDLTDFVDGVKSFFESFDDADKQAITDIVTSVKDIIDKFNLPSLSDIITKVADGLGKFFDTFGKVKDVGLELIAEIISQLKRDFDTWAPGVAAVAGAILAFNAAVGAMNIIQSAPALLNSFKTAMAGLNAVMAANPIALVISLLAGLVAWFITAYNTNEEFRQKVDEAWNDIKTFAVDLWKALEKTFTEDIPDSISEGIENLKRKASELLQAGKDLIQGFINGIKEKIGAIKDAVGEAAGTAVTWIKDKLGIESPSKVFAEIGRYSMEGLAVGFESGYDKYSQRIGSVIDDLIPSNMTASVDFASSSLGKSSSAQINTMLAGMEQTGGVYNINLVVDGRTLANVVFDPLNAVSKQKGVAIGA